MIFYNWLLMKAGALISGFDGQIVLSGFYNYVICKGQWTYYNVYWIYLLPWFGWLLIYMLLSYNRKFPTKLPLFVQMMQGWMVAVVMINSFWMPLVDIITHTGIYHALQWMGISYILQITMGIVIALYFIYKQFVLSPLFSTTVNLPQMDIPRKSIATQLTFVWYLPVVVVVMLFLFLFGVSFLSIGVAFFVIVVFNSFLFFRYRVVV